MDQRASFKYRIAGIMLVALALVSITGIYTYRQFTEVVLSLGKDALPDMRLATTKALINHISDAESNVRSYNLAKDSVFIQNFDRALASTETTLEQLRSLNINYDRVTVELDSLDSLISEKVIILNEWLHIQDPYRADDALRRADKQIEDAAQEPSGGLLGINKGRQKKKKNQDDDDQEVTLADVSEEISKIKREEAYIEKILRQEELDILIKSKDVSDRIRSKLELIEILELERISEKTRNAEITVERTNKRIALFCVSMGALLLFMAFIIVNYVRNNDRYRQKLMLARTEAMEMAKTKERFLANMSHEIRTPMNAIVGFSEQLGKSNLSVEQQDQVEMLKRSSDHMLHVINDILDLTKLQDKKLKLEMIPFSPVAVAEEAAEFIRPTANDKGLEIKINSSIDPQFHVQGDPHRLRQILLNLLSNAVKFTDEGEVSLSIAKEKGSENDERFTFEIRDTGIGMNEEQVVAALQEFEQAELGTARKYGGSGLGLSIVDMLVKLHGGNLKVESKPGKGTIVWAKIPYKVADLSSETFQDSVVQMPDPNFLNGVRVLIVDDEQYNRKLLATVLSKHGAEFLQAENGSEAVEFMELEHFDLVLMDARMPVLNGYEATAAIRAFPGLKKDVPILILTAAVTEEDIALSKGVNVNGMLSKPFKENELLDAMKEALTKGGPDTKENEASTLSTVPKMDFKALWELGNNDPDFYRDMLELFVQSTESGVKGILTAQARKDQLAIAESAHKMSGPCRHLGAEELHSTLHGMEVLARENKDNSAQLGPMVEQLERYAQEAIALVNAELKKAQKKNSLT